MIFNHLKYAETHHEKLRDGFTLERKWKLWWSHSLLMQDCLINRWYTKDNELSCYKTKNMEKQILKHFSFFQDSNPKFEKSGEKFHFWNWKKNWLLTNKIGSETAILWLQAWKKFHIFNKPHTSNIPWKITTICH